MVYTRIWMRCNGILKKTVPLLSFIGFIENEKEKEMKTIDEETSGRIRYMNFIIIGFAKGAKMLIPDAYTYLRNYGGIDFLYRHYEYEHTQPEIYTYMTLLNICRRNGGYL